MLPLSGDDSVLPLTGNSPAGRKTRVWAVHPLTPLRKRAASLARRLEAAYERARLRRCSFAIISNNCWGYEIYKHLCRPYNTPFVGLYMYPECYLRLLTHGFPEKLKTLRLVEGSRRFRDRPGYPLGVLADGEEVHFLHERVPADALAKWHRRTERLLIEMGRGLLPHVKLCDRDGCAPEHFETFHASGLRPRVSIALYAMNDPQHVAAPLLKDPAQSNVVDGRELFRRRAEYMNLAEWLISGNVTRTPLNRLVCSLRTRE